MTIFLGQQYIILNVLTRPADFLSNTTKPNQYLIVFVRASAQYGGKYANVRAFKASRELYAVAYSITK